MTRFPAPLKPGDRIAVTSPSSGVSAALWPRIEASIAALRARGFEVVVGECMADDRVVSAPKEQRAAELVAMLSDPLVAAVVPPWGGETSIDLLDQIDWDALGEAEPTWLVGWSDICTVALPLTLRTGWATLHGGNLADSAYAAPAGLLHWVDVASATAGPLTQTSPGRTRQGWDDYVSDPEVATMTLDRQTRWSVLGGGDVEMSGVLIGGCLEVVSPMAGTPYADVRGFGERHAEEGLLVYVEACEHGAYDVARQLHGLRLAGWFDHASGVLIGRTAAPDAEKMTQHEAVIDALGMLEVPIVLDTDIGHTQPFLPLINGASATVKVDGGRGVVSQRLG
ncbi:S66 peptidase family protein [Nocardioides sp.]|uniref:S66 family peptidase n=1 Tax=Nocardioides sp. TaxID=35761 RepID=UPI00356282DB